MAPTIDKKVRVRFAPSPTGYLHVGGNRTHGFKTELLVRAHRRAVSRGFVSSDDGTLVFALGEPVRTIPGERTNIKVTYEDDIRVAEAILELQRQS